MCKIFMMNLIAQSRVSSIQGLRNLYNKRAKVSNLLLLAMVFMIREMKKMYCVIYHTCKAFGPLNMVQQPLIIGMDV